MTCQAHWSRLAIRGAMPWGCSSRRGTLTGGLRSCAATPAGQPALTRWQLATELAARFLGEVGDIRRFPTKHHFAAHTGTAPLEASSGQVIRHRLSRAGDRKLNHALYMMAMVQVRRPS